MSLGRRIRAIAFISIIFNLFPYFQVQADAPLAGAHAQHIFIRNISVQGNHYSTTDAILNKLPYKEKMPFDSEKSSDAITSVYSLGHFKQIIIEKKTVNATTIDLVIRVEEKNILEKIEFSGNKEIKKKKLLEKLKTENKETIDEEDAELYTKALKDFYRDEGFYFTSIQSSFIENAENSQKVKLLLTIDEGVKSHVTRVYFKGNAIFSSAKLSTLIATRERWLLSALDGSGKYTQEMLDMDKRFIERFYQDQGYLLAKVIDATIEFSPDKTQIWATFSIEEGKQFKVRNIHAPGDDIFLEEELLPHILIEKGKPYSVSKVIQSLEKLKELWGDKGYINADVYPQPLPNEETGEVDITFLADHGNKVHVNRIDITGNEITRDKIIRRNIDIQEGELITSKKMDRSKDAVERLSFFQRGGVNWKMHRLDDKTADLELNVKEAKTGSFNLKGSVGSEDNSNKRSFRIGLDLDKRNFMGEAIDVGAQATLQLARNGSQFFEFHLSNPYLFDTDTKGFVSLYRRKQEFPEWRNVRSTPAITQWGGAGSLGFNLPFIDKDLFLSVETGLEDVVAKRPIARDSSASDTAALQTIINRAFQSTIVQWFGMNLVLDTRNHAIYPTHGFKIIQSNKIALPGLNAHYAFAKSEFEASYYTPLIGEDSLVLALRAKAGTVQTLGNSYDIPYNELFHMGGQTTVRGFAFGSIGPAWKNQDPLGAKNALLFNAEIIFPILAEYQMKGHFFYDAGAGWDTPKRGTAKPELITRNSFNIRHAVGFGFNLLSPQPMKIDWGYKLDRNKKAGESSHEFHLQANLAF